jgi:hypothetical protein
LTDTKIRSLKPRKKAFKMQSGRPTKILGKRYLTGSFYPKQSFKLLEKPFREGRESANGSH